MRTPRHGAGVCRKLSSNYKCDSLVRVFAALDKSASALHSSCLQNNRYGRTCTTSYGAMHPVHFSSLFPPCTPCLPYIIIVQGCGKTYAAVTVGPETMSSSSSTSTISKASSSNSSSSSARTKARTGGNAMRSDGTNPHLPDVLVPRRDWQDLPSSGDTSWKNVFGKLADATSVWSVVGATVGCFVLACLLFLYMRPPFLMAKNKEGDPPRLSLGKLVACAFALAATVGGIDAYLLYSGRQA